MTFSDQFVWNSAYEKIAQTCSPSRLVDLNKSAIKYAACASARNIVHSQNEAAFKIIFYHCNYLPIFYTVDLSIRYFSHPNGRV